MWSAEGKATVRTVVATARLSDGVNTLATVLTSALDPAQNLDPHRSDRLWASRKPVRSAASRKAELVGCVPRRSALMKLCGPIRPGSLRAGLSASRRA